MSIPWEHMNTANYFNLTASLAVELSVGTITKMECPCKTFLNDHSENVQDWDRSSYYSYGLTLCC